MMEAKEERYPPTEVLAVAQTVAEEQMGLLPRLIPEAMGLSVAEAAVVVDMLDGVRLVLGLAVLEAAVAEETASFI